jgi:RNA polymerase sigma factor (sigma-70 family)
VKTPDSPQSPSPALASFATTQWTKILAAKGDSPESQSALSDLCESYYAPVHSFIQRRVSGADDAKDLTHDFFESVLRRSPFENLDPGKSKFRTYLLGAVKHFLSNSNRKLRRQKRGSGQWHAPLSENEESPSEETQEDQQFDYQWALNLMARALSKLESEFEKSHRQTHFEKLKPWLVGLNDSLSQKDVGMELGLSEGAIKVAIHRLRKRFRDHIKNEIADTLGPNDAIEEELRYLVEVLSNE